MAFAPDVWKRAFALFDACAGARPGDPPPTLDAIARDESDDVRRALQQLLEDGCEAGDRLIADVASAAATAFESLAGDEGGDDAAAGSRVGPWRLVREIGRGGMGLVYLAERADGEFQQRVALKRIRGGIATEEVLTRFLRERRILARLEHPNIARLIDGGADESGRPYFAMEFIDGEPITAYCERLGLSIDDRLRLVVAAGHAVAFAHRSLVVHRDLKPSNILVTGDGTVKLLDFGIARLLAMDDAADDPATIDRRVLTPAYAAPEQVRGEPATTATDVHGLGTVLFELLTGHRVHEAPDSSPHTLARLIVEEDAPAPSTKAPPDRRRYLRGDLDAITRTALARAPGRRYRSVEALCADLERFLARLPVEARAAPVGERVGKFLVRHRVGVAAATLVVVVGGAGITATLWQARATARAARRAEAVTAFLTSIFRESDPSEARGASVTAREVLDRGAARVRSELVDQPEVRVEMLRVIGDLYRQLGLLEAAAPLLNEAVDTARRLHGPSSAESAAALDRWGVLLWDRGDYDEAARTLEASVALRRSIFGRDSAEVSASLGALASVYSDLGRDDEAERLHREALAIDERRFGRDSLQAAASLANLAIKVEERRAFDEAEPMQQRALDLRRRLGGPDHPDVAESLLALGVLRSKRGDYPQAEAHFREAIALTRRVYGLRHPKVAHLLDNLATTLEHRGALVDSLATAREALEIRREVFPPTHPDLALSINNFAVTSYRLGFFEDAERAFREAHAAFASTLGPDHNYTTTALANLGLTLRERGDLAQAESISRRALDARVRTRGAASPEVSQSLRNVGLILMDRGRRAEAGALLDRAVAVARSAYPVDHPRQAEVMVALARWRLDGGDTADAVSLLRDALRIREAKLGATAWQIAEARMWLGAALCGSPDTAAEAESLFGRAIDAFSNPELPSWRAAEARMRQATCGAPSPGRARAIRASLDVFHATLGDRHPLTAEARRRLER